MTEDEAKTKWCPHARVHKGEGGNRYPMDIDAVGVSAYTRCIGSGCMMWREVSSQRKEIDGKLVMYGGHCGLAGKP